MAMRSEKEGGVPMTQPAAATMRGGGFGTLLLVPGPGFDRRVWGRLTGRLAAHYHVVHVDRPGPHGPADPPGSSDPTTAAGAPADQPPGASAAVAYAGGTAEAVRLARRGLVRALVLFHPTVGRRLPELDIDYDATLASRLPQFEWAPETATIADEAQRRQAWASHLRPALEPMRQAGVPPTDFDEILQMFVDSLDTMITAKGYARAPAAAGEDWVDGLAELDLPALVISTPSEDAPRQVATAVARRLPRGQLRLLESALPGMPWLLDPAGVTREVVAFLHSCG